MDGEGAARGGGVFRNMPGGVFTGHGRRGYGMLGNSRSPLSSFTNQRVLMSTSTNDAAHVYPTGEMGPHPPATPQAASTAARGGESRVELTLLERAAPVAPPTAAQLKNLAASSNSIDGTAVHTQEVPRGSLDIKAEATRGIAPGGLDPPTRMPAVPP